MPQNHPLSPLDGRYASRVEPLASIFSEFGLARARIFVEIEWLLHLAKLGISPEISEKTATKLRKVAQKFSDADFAKIKEIEQTTNHDVKAVEYFLRDFTPKKLWPWIHFACTSEDVNNSAYGLILRDGVREILVAIDEILTDLREKSFAWKSNPILSRTHGQTATPSTMGKEIAVFWHRISAIRERFSKIQITAKFNGATGNFAAHAVAFPRKNWIKISKNFIENRLELAWNPLTTQIESHDNSCAILNEISQLSSVQIDLCRDIWGYISLGYFGQRVVAGEVGSSTMPHKVNPIDFENAEGNFTLARGIARTMADALPISRWQRDLTDSTLQRNFGLAFGHFFLAMKSMKKGLGKLEIRETAMLADLESSPEVLTEAVQTILRANGCADAYEQLKSFSRGQKLTLAQIHEFVGSAVISEADRGRLIELLPENYIGLSEKLVEKFVK